jgi:Flp pilus assembly pilin Flp
MARWPRWAAMRRTAWRDRRGQALVEYALILARVAIAVLGVLGTVGQHANNVFGNVVSHL